MSTWVVGDVHGHYDEFMRLINNNEVKAEDKFILIGDIINRGPDSVKMMQWALNNVKLGGKYELLYGDHENEFVLAYNRAVNDYEHVKFINDREGKETPDEIMYLDTYYHIEDQLLNAGYTTLASIKPFVEMFQQLPLVIDLHIENNKHTYKSYRLVHGWYEKGSERPVWMSNDLKFGFLLGDDYKPETDEILIHGHIPTIHIDDDREEKNTILFREHSINIDCGIGQAEEDGRLAMIRLEDLKVIYA